MGFIHVIIRRVYFVAQFIIQYSTHPEAGFVSPVVLFAGVRVQPGRVERHQVGTARLTVGQRQLGQLRELELQRPQHGGPARTPPPGGSRPRPRPDAATKRRPPAT